MPHPPDAGAYRQHSVATLAHGNQGRKPRNAVPDDAANAVVRRLASAPYAGANHTHLSEPLREREGIDLSRPTVHRIPAKSGIGIARSRRPHTAPFSPPTDAPGGDADPDRRQTSRLVGGARTQFALLLAVDDAASAVVNAVFCVSEDTAGSFTLLEG